MERSCPVRIIQVLILVHVCAKSLASSGRFADCCAFLRVFFVRPKARL